MTVTLGVLPLSVAVEVALVAVCVSPLVLLALLYKDIREKKLW